MSWLRGLRLSFANAFKGGGHESGQKHESDPAEHHEEAHND